MALEKIYQGEERQIDIYVSDAEGADYDLTVFDAIIAYIIIGGKVIAKYQLPTTAGYGELTVDAIETNKASIRLEYATSKTMPTGTMEIELKCFKDTEEKFTVRFDAFCAVSAFTKNEQG